jgi:nicotinate phosphoribosyltransferase
MVEAGRRYGLPLSGTMAHSYVMAHDTERAAFTAFLHRYREASVLLVDTYDTLAGTRAAVDAMAETGIVARGIRIDSGDLSALATDARRILDDAGLSSVQVLVSGDLDEHRVAELVAAGAPIDAFGVGTRMGTSSDAPYLGVVYKLVEQGGEPRSKSSPDKATLPGRKQVWRGPDGDTLALASEAGPPDARPLLELVWHDGRRLGPPGDLGAARDRCAAALAAWTGVPPAVEVSAELLALAREPAARGRGASRT